MKTIRIIKIPSEIDVSLIERQILELYPNINEKKKNLSVIFTERVLFFLNEIRKSIYYNEQLYLRDRLLKESIPYTQQSKRKRLKMFPKPSDSKYSRAIFEKVLFRYIDVKKYDHKEYGLVDLYVSGKLCKQYYFRHQPSSYKDFIIETTDVQQIVETVEELELINTELTSEQNEVRKQIIVNTKQFILLNNNNSVSILTDYLKRVDVSPSSFIEAFNNNDGRSIIDSFGYRLHHKLTTLKGNLLDYVRLENKEVIGLDIVNSQPFFSSIISEEVVKRMISQNPYMSFLKPILPILSIYEENEDYVEYKRLCRNGQLYEYLLEKYDDDKVEITREKIKKIIFIAFFSDYKKHTDYKKKQLKKSVELFKKCFPSVYNTFYEIQQLDLKLKVLNHNTEGQESRKNTALILQRIESCYIYNYLAPKLISNDITFSTIHDSILIVNDESIISLCKKAMIESFQQLGVEPPIIKKK